MARAVGIEWDGRLTRTYSLHVRSCSTSLRYNMDICKKRQMSIWSTALAPLLTAADDDDANGRAVQCSVSRSWSGQQTLHLKDP